MSNTLSPFDPVSHIIIKATVVLNNGVKKEIELQVYPTHSEITNDKIVGRVDFAECWSYFAFDEPAPTNNEGE